MPSQNVDAHVREHLEAARAHSSGRSSGLVLGGRQTRMTQTVVAMTAGTSLSEHENPGEASVLVLEGQVRLDVGEISEEGGRGALLEVPPSRHSLHAVTDSAVLLTAFKSD